jgi:hypothetical protein
MAHSALGAGSEGGVTTDLGGVAADLGAWVTVGRPRPPMRFRVVRQVYSHGVVVVRPWSLLNLS